MNMAVYARFRFAKWKYNRLTDDADFGKKKKMIFSDDAHFDLGGYINKYIEKPMNLKRATVWCGF